jgi:biopolymer transport protein ExbB/TolQ
MFPLLGMLGTVISLIPMVNLIGTETTGAFFAALTSTFWGIVAALVFKFLDSFLSYKIEDNEKHMEFLLNPGKRD